MLQFIPMLSSAIASVTASVSSIGPAIASFCSTVLPKIGSSIETINSISNITSQLANILGIFKDDEQIGEIGDRALHASAHGIKPANFDKYEEYLGAIRSYALHPNQSDKYSSIEKAMSGLAITLAGIEDKFKLAEGALTLLPVLAALSPAYFTAGRLAAILVLTKDIDSVLEYFGDTLDKKDRNAVEDILIRADQILYPGNEPEEIRENLAKVMEHFKKAVSEQ